MQQDKANFVRQEIQKSRDPGSSHFAFRIKAILRTGRKFKALAILPDLDLAGGREAVGRSKVLHAFGSHYAAAEGASEATVSRCLRDRARMPTWNARMCPHSPIWPVRWHPSADTRQELSPAYP